MTAAQKTVTEKVFSSEKYDADWIPDNLLKAISWLNAKLAEIPAEFRQTAELCIDASSFYDSATPSIEISYTRPQNDEDVREEEEQLAQSLARQQRDEMEQLRRLRIKYPDQFPEPTKR
jgi:hypothetical protein